MGQKSPVTTFSAPANKKTMKTPWGNGDGTFAGRVSYSMGGQPAQVALGDLNGNGILDVVTADYSASTGQTISIRLGNGDGSFGARSTYSTGIGEPYDLALGDLTGNGVLDIVTSNTHSNLNNAKYNTIFIANSTLIEGSISRVGLEPQSHISITNTVAALQAQDILKGYLKQVNYVKGVVGASMSRLEVAASNTRNMFENTRAAAARIMDADTAQDISLLLSAQIGQKVASAILAQANQRPALALLLLEN